MATLLLFLAIRSPTLFLPHFQATISTFLKALYFIQEWILQDELSKVDKTPLLQYKTSPIPTRPAMKKSHKAALLSTTVFPGAGYFMLAKPIRGVLALFVALATLFFVMKEAMFKANLIANDILAGKQTFDPLQITEQLLHGPSLYGPEFIKTLSYFIVATWVYTAIDCYRLGKKLEQAA